MIPNNPVRRIRNRSFHLNPDPNFRNLRQDGKHSLKLKRATHESRKSARKVFAYGGTQPLPTIGTFTADVMLTGNNNGCRADFVLIKGDSRTLPGRETADILTLLNIGPFQANNADGVGLASFIRKKYKTLFTFIDLLKGCELKLYIDKSLKPVAQPVGRTPFGLPRRWTRRSTCIWGSTLYGPSRWILIFGSGS